MKPANISEYVAARVIEHMRYRDAELETLNDIIQRSGIVKCSHCNLYCGSNQAEHCHVCDLWYCCGSNIICIQTWNISGTNMCEKCIPDTCMNCALNVEMLNANIATMRVQLMVCGSAVIEPNNIFKCTRWHYD